MNTENRIVNVKWGRMGRFNKLARIDKSVGGSRGGGFTSPYGRGYCKLQIGNTLTNDSIVEYHFGETLD